MKGIIFTGKEAKCVEGLIVRDPLAKEVLVRIQAAGICHSDLSVINGTIPYPLPVVLGHEGAGVVEAVGSDVKSLKVGDHVVIATLANCGVCRACSTGMPTRCSRSLGKVDAPFVFEGSPAHNFAAASVFAELTVVREVQAVKIGKDIPFTSACLIGCGVLTGVGTVLNRCGVRPGTSAVVFGVGGVGLNVIQGLRIAGATKIIAVDTMASKKSLALRFGATDFVDASASTDPASKAIRSLCPPNRESAAGSLSPEGGVTWAFDCVGHEAVLSDALASLDWGGTAVAIGIPPRGTCVSVDVNALAYVDRGLLGCRYGSARPHHDIPLMIDLYRNGSLLLDELVSMTCPMAEFETIVSAMEDGSIARGVIEIG